MGALDILVTQQKFYWMIYGKKEYTVQEGKNIKLENRKIIF